MAAVEILAKRAVLLEPGDLAVAERLVRDSTSWVYVDQLAEKVVGSLVVTRPWVLHWTCGSATPTCGFGARPSWRCSPVSGQALQTWTGLPASPAWSGRLPCWAVYFARASLTVRATCLLGLSSRVVSGAVGGPGCVDAGALAGSERVHAGVVAVVHVVVDGVGARGSAGVFAGGATVGGVALLRRVGYPVALASAAILEGVVQTEPVPDLVRDRKSVV